MAEAGSFADRVKTQADIVRVVGDYVRLKKSGQNFMGLCPFHSEKTPSFAVHPVKQIYHCFGCGLGGDVFSFVMAMEKCEFREAVTLVAEKCGIPLPKAKPRTPEEKHATEQRAALMEMHREAAAFFATQLMETAEGRVAQAYLEDRGLDRATIEHFGLGYAPSSGDALVKHLRAKYSEKLLEASGLAARDPGGRLYDRFRRRIVFPIANESGKVVAFGGRALGDDLPKYLNSPETAIYTKSRILYNLHQAKDVLRPLKYEERRMVLVEGYVDCMRAHSAGLPYVVASCGTSLTEMHAQLLRRFAPRVVVWYDEDSAGKAATDRSLDVLLAHGLLVEVYPYLTSSGADPDAYIRDVGAEASRAPIASAFDRLARVMQAEEAKATAKKRVRELEKTEPFLLDLLGKQAEIRDQIREIESQIPKVEKGAPKLLSYQDFLTTRVGTLFDLSVPDGKLRAINFLLPYLQKVADPLLRSEWATRIAQQLRIEEPVLRESLRRAAAERRSEVKPKPELMTAPVKPAERRLIQMLVEGEGFRKKLARAIAEEELHRGLETETILAALIAAAEQGRPDPAELAAALEERDRRLLFAIVFEPAAEPAWDEAESCLAVLRRRKVEAELVAVQKEIEAQPQAGELRKLLERKQALRRQLAALAG